DDLFALAALDVVQLRRIDDLQSRQRQGLPGERAVCIHWCPSPFTVEPPGLWICRMMGRLSPSGNWKRSLIMEGSSVLGSYQMAFSMALPTDAPLAAPTVPVTMAPGPVGAPITVPTTPPMKPPTSDPNQPPPSVDCNSARSTGCQASAAARGLLVFMDVL